MKSEQVAGFVSESMAGFIGIRKQRSAWARESLLVNGEMEEYEDRLADEWSRYKDVVFASGNG